MKITVIVPTYRRPKDLSRCLEALKKQTRPADELLVVVRDTDAETWIFMETFTSETLPLRTVTVSAPGAIAAMNAGLDAASGEIVSFTDDDAAPHTDWLARIEPHFLSDSRVGGVGGRDWVYHGTDLVEGAKEVVGQVQWFGRAIGNHHLGVGEAREVDVLKGVNMSFRWTAIKNKHFDQRMQGTSAQIHHEIEFCLALKKAGWKLIYDPKVAVDHHTGQRFDEDQRNKFNPIAMKNIVCNETLALLEHLPSTRRVVFLTWAILVGTRGEPGLVQWLRFMPSQGSLATQKLQASLQGRRQGWQTWQQSRLGKDV
ncbi:MAG: glycosyl transferase family A [Cyanobacteria bacterium QS_6_48_18]|nr:MAG: glycosyl transferase family A [Cyanobacteria bacterium QS_6_48_18]